MKQFFIYLLLAAATLCLFVYYSHQDMYNQIVWRIGNASITENVDIEADAFPKLITRANASITEKIDTEADSFSKLITPANASITEKVDTEADAFSKLITPAIASVTEKVDTETNVFPKLITPASIKESDNNIFFIETTCGTENLLESQNFSRSIHLNPRQCCSVESAAIMNKNHNIYILYTCLLNRKIYEESPDYIKKSLAHTNVYLVSLILKEYFQGTPVHELYQSNKISSSLYPLEHLSDVLRFLTLWKYGGTYLDLDTITTRCLDRLKYNYAGLEFYTVGSAVLNFKFDGIGHDILTRLLRDLSVTFNGIQWIANGPGLVTRLLMQHCNFSKEEQLATENCSDFTIHESKYFYPIHYPAHNTFFTEMTSDQLEKTFNESYVIHFWNRLSKNTIVEVGSNQVYGVLANKFCPGAYHNCGKFF